jgi:hypothetical protein
MTKPATPVMTGGCQCGAVRYALHTLPEAADICHCRMCQRAVGNVLMATASLRRDDLTWTSGAPTTYRSSSIAERGFCGRCGTPLFFRYVNEDHIAVTIGSLDQPEHVRPTHQYGIESRLPWFRELADLPGARTEDDPPPGGLEGLISHQAKITD